MRFPVVGVLWKNGNLLFALLVPVVLPSVLPSVLSVITGSHAQPGMSLPAVHMAQCPAATEKRPGQEAAGRCVRCCMRFGGGVISRPDRLF
ncbi:hypothetical protein DSM19430T_07030 [Desulfovibrio psychrotolerans]|uniref:Uncharacterized protein n=1 Tax=Desulfovibrio psychrotolerans TaxID=415242 RepID=A0A7J0BQR5_9BACT|nr:hypothetical protein DSM19430T_07030 [Desulfovibrio psychrotolerans]